MFLRYALLILISSHFAAGQSRYTKLRAAYGVEAFGISPKASVTAEAMFRYRKSNFVDVQAGLGWVQSQRITSPTGSLALTFCQLLNPYKQNSCNPYPGHNLIETYLEAGLASFFIDGYDSDLFSGRQDRQRMMTPLALAGFRMHVVGARWVYVFKLRYTPALLESKIASWGGIGVGLGWR